MTCIEKIILAFVAVQVVSVLAKPYEPAYDDGLYHSNDDMEDFHYKRATPKEPFMCPTCDDCEDDNFTYESCTEAEDVGPDPVCVVLKDNEEDEPSYVYRFCESREKYNRSLIPYCKSKEGCSLAMCEESRCKAELPDSETP